MVLSPKSLWQNYDRSLLPLETSEIRTVKTENGTEKFFYFNGETTAMGCARIYARLVSPETETTKLVIAFLEPQDDIATADFSPLIKTGYAVLAVDYAGNSFSRQRFTIYPPALEFANYDAETLFVPTETPQKNCWYIWTSIVLRSITFAESRGFGCVALLGAGIGGAHVFKAAALSRYPVCGISLFSPTFFPDSDDNELLKISACLDVYGYAPLLKIPFLQLCCSNDSDSSLDDISDLNEHTGGRSLLYISPRRDKSCSETINKDILKFLETYLDEEDSFNPRFIGSYGKTASEIMSLSDDNQLAEQNDGPSLVPPLVLSANGSEKKLYYSIKCTEEITEAALYVSHGITNSSYRNWRALPIEKVGEDEYLGCTEVYSIEKPIYTFACVSTQNGFCFSSPVLRKIPSQLKVMPTTIAKRRLVYDSDMGIDDFFTMGNSPKPVMNKGPFDISGISGKNNLCTYKIGDATFSGQRDGVLQLLMYSPVAQKVKFSVTDGEQFITYVCEQSVSPDNDWEKIMLPASSFKSAEGVFSSWDKAVFLRIDSQEEIIISSVLWV